MVRVLAACLYASITYIPALFLLAAITGDLDNALLGPYVIVGYFVSLICVIVVGVPTYFLLEMRGKRSASYYALIGFLVLFGFVLVTQPFGKDGTLAVLLQSAIFGVVGLASALVFWWFAVRGRLGIEHQ